MKISEILAKHETDKEVHHNYGKAYDELFSRFDREAPLNILEIGIEKGGSLLAWKEYFPNASITGVDIKDMVKDRYRSKKINYVFSDIKDWKTDQTFDIIIDDGSHFEEDVAYVIKHYKGKLREGGMLIVEDVQDTSKWNYDLIRCGENYDDVLMVIYA
jgi:trans-aconitate methyltransferase